MNRARFLILIIILAFQLSCDRSERSMDIKDTLFTLLDNTGIDFKNTITNTKAFNIFKYRNFYNGAGVAIGDINNDSLPDVFFTANMGSNKLYLNKGQLKFEDISEKSGFHPKQDWSTGVVMVDINNDGWLDIYVCNAGYIDDKAPKNQLFINNHDLTFTDSAAAYGLTNLGGYCTHAAFFDYDMDGDLDCYILNNSFIPVNTLNYANRRDLRANEWPVADFLKGGGDKLLRNDNGHYNDVSEQAKIYGSLIGFGLGVTVGDVNNDLYPDIYVSNDFFERDYLYINQKDGTFKEDLELRMQHISHSSMGADMGDLDNDGNPEIFVTEMLPGDEIRFKTTASFENTDIQKLKINAGFYSQFMQNTLQYNNGNGTFSETAFYSGVAATDWSWGGLLFDADNDGLNDLFVCNGIYNDLTDQDFIDFFANDIIQNMALTGKKEEIDEIINKMPSIPIPNKAYHNIGNLQFEDAGPSWGTETPSFSNGAAYGDLDNDGDMDLVINNVNEMCFVYRNNESQKNANHFLGLNLKQDGPNNYAIGSTVKLYIGKQVLTRELIPARGFQSSMDYKLIFGLGKQVPDSMQVIWPDKTFESFTKPAIDSYHNILKSRNTKPYIPKSLKIKPVFKEEETPFDKHQEEEYTDFYFERNVPELLSAEGPASATADVNDDGLTDIFIGGAAGQAGVLYLQTSRGFTKTVQPVFAQHAVFEDATALFFDGDKDGDADLFVGSGGNNRPAGSQEFQNRFYLNDGHGNFSIEANAFSGEKGMNTSVAAADDFDQDGDLDLFVGSRSVPMQYGSTPVSYLFQNDGKGHFTNIATGKNEALANAGMITGAQWCDINGDKRNELVLCGEWMAPKIFSYNGDQFVELKSNLSSLQGWWQTISSADLDGDGDNDLLLGNAGENFYLQPNEKEPVKLWLGDFDENKVMDKIITRTVSGKDLPVFLKRELTDQLPNIKKQNLRHVEYAKKSIQDLLGDELNKAEVKQFNFCSSVIAYNDGKGNFDTKKLSLPLQLSTVNSFCTWDINGDGKKDIIAGGNRFGFLPQFCRLDANYGSVLINEGKGNFKTLSQTESGISIRGEVRGIHMVTIGKKNALIIIRNNLKPSIFFLEKS